MYKLFIFSLVSLYANFSFGAVCDTVIVGNGIRYEGQYPCGEGVLYSDSLGIYIGHFERGIPNGVCTHYKKNGHRYYGEFKDHLLMKSEDHVTSYFSAIASFFGSEMSIVLKTSVPFFSSSANSASTASLAFFSIAMQVAHRYLL